jgi:hypothetical protein
MVTTYNIPLNTIPALTPMEAATAAGVHLSAIYKQRSRLQAFKRAGVWPVPLADLDKYIQERQHRARQILKRRVVGQATPEAFLNSSGAGRPMLQAPER